MNYIDNWFHFYYDKAGFEANKEANLINPDSICFIKETSQIYTQNTLFGIPKAEYEALEKKVTDLKKDVLIINEATLPQINTIIEDISTTVAQHGTSIGELSTSITNIKNSIGIAGGIAPLDDYGLIPINHLPSYVDDVEIVPSYADLPGKSAAVTDRIYVTADTNITYRWTGESYIEISKSIGLGETSSTAYAGNKGKKNADDISVLKNIINSLPEAISIPSPYNSNTERVPTDDNGTNILVQNHSCATKNPDTGEYYTFADYYSIRMPRFTFNPAQAGLIDTKYAEYLKKLIYDNRANGNIASSDLDITDNDITFNTTTVHAEFNEDGSRMTNSTTTTKSQVIPIATTSNVGLMSAEDKLALDGKADITDLSNVLAEEVVDSTTLEGIDTFTREEAKKDLFIDMWNQACGDYGRYNASTGYFELNGLADITYEQALDIYNYGRFDITVNSVGKGSTSSLNYNLFRTNIIPITGLDAMVSCGNMNNFCYEQSLLEVCAIGYHMNDEFIDEAYTTSPTNLSGSFRNCYKLKELRGIINLNRYSHNNVNNIFIGCNKLEEIHFHRLKCNLDLRYTPKLSLNSFKEIIEFAINTSPITITVHPDVYTKLTDTSNTEWNKVLTDAATKQISFVTA